VTKSPTTVDGSFFLAVLLIIAGAAAIAFPVVSSLAVELSTAIVFATAGVAQTIHSFAVRSWGGFFLGLLIGLLYLAAGVVLWLNPLARVVTLTVFLAAVLVVDGACRSILALQVRPRSGWLWLLFGGIVGIVLAIMIWEQQPSSALWVLGLLLGINLVFFGLHVPDAFSNRARGSDRDSLSRPDAKRRRRRTNAAHLCRGTGALCGRRGRGRGQAAGTTALRDA
jgi:uncharacterized membrane protein HdeD (DUF308 family)